MPTLNTYNRRLFAANLEWIRAKKSVPDDALARAAMVDQATMEEWLDAKAKSPLNIGQEQLRRLADFFGVSAMSHFYSCTLDSFKIQVLAGYGAEGNPDKSTKKDQAPSDAPPAKPPRLKPGPKPRCPNVPPAQSASSTPSVSVGVSPSDPDSKLRALLLDLLSYPSISLKEGICVIVKHLS